MKILLVVSIVVLCANFSFADDDLETQYTSLQTKITNTQNAYNQIKQQKAAAQAKIAELNKQLVDNGCGYVGVCNNPNAVMTNAQANAARKQIQDLSDSVAKLDAASTDNQKLAATYAATSADLSSKIKDPTYRIQKVERTQSLMAQNDVISKGVIDAKIDVNHMEASLNKLEAEMDKTRIGIYLQDKMGALLNSHLFCDDVKNHCLGKDRTVIGQKEMKEIFPQISDANSRNGEEQRHRTWDQTSSTSK